MLRGPANGDKLASLMTKREAIAAHLYAACLTNRVSAEDSNYGEYWQRFAVRQTDALLKILAEDNDDG